MRTDEVEPALSRAPTEVIADYLRSSISLSNIAREIWAGKWVIATAIAIALVYGAYTVHKSGASYTATMQISPADTDNSGALAGASSLFAGLGGSGAMVVPKFTQFLADISSVGVAKMLDEQYDMLCRVYRGDCNQVTHQWTERTGFWESVAAAQAWLGGLPNPNGPRTLSDLAAYTGGSVVATQNKTSSLVVLSYSHSDPKFAAFFLSAVVKTTNDYIRTQNREIQRRYVENVTQSIARNTNVQQRETLDQLLLQEERQLMLAEVDVPYAASILDGPNVLPVNPVKRTLMIYGFFGMLIGLAVTLLRKRLPHRWRF
jgi:hypothetical protein